MALFGGVTLPGRPDLDNIRKLDLLPMDQIRRMMRVGIAIDPPWFNDLSIKLEGEKTRLYSDIIDCIPPDVVAQFVSDPDGEDDLPEIELNINSSEQVSDLLFKYLKVGEGTKLKRTKSGARLSSGKKQLEQLKRQHPVIPKILLYKEYSKLQNTFTDVLPKMAVMHNRGECRVCGLWHWRDHPRIHSQILTTSTAPGRLSMMKPNLQQIPSRTEMGREVRKGFVASLGNKIVTRDASQLHLRFIAHMGNVTAMIEVFNHGGDIHIETARKAFGLGPNDPVDKTTQRDPSKTTNFLIAYGGGGATLFDTLVLNFAIAGIDVPEWLTLDWCEEFIAIWFSIYPEVARYFSIQNYRNRRYGLGWCPFGRIRRVPEIRSCHERVEAAGLRQGANHPIIAMEAGMMKIAQARIETRLVEIRNAGVHAEAVLPVHDELLMEVEEDWAEDTGEIAGYEIEHALEDVDTGEFMMRVPMKSDGKVKDRWEK